jgi:hypothetical protein
MHNILDFYRPGENVLCFHTRVNSEGDKGGWTTWTGEWGIACRNKMEPTAAPTSSNTAETHPPPSWSPSPLGGDWIEIVYLWRNVYMMQVAVESKM